MNYFPPVSTPVDSAGNPVVVPMYVQQQQQQQQLQQMQQAQMQQQAHMHQFQQQQQQLTAHVNPAALVAASRSMQPHQAPYAPPTVSGPLVSDPLPGQSIPVSNDMLGEFDLGNIALPELLNGINPALMDEFKVDAPQILSALLKQEVRPSHLLPQDSNSVQPPQENNLNAFLDEVVSGTSSLTSTVSGTVPTVQPAPPVQSVQQSQPPQQAPVQQSQPSVQSLQPTQTQQPVVPVLASSAQRTQLQPLSPQTSNAVSTRVAVAAAAAAAAAGVTAPLRPSSPHPAHAKVGEKRSKSRTKPQSPSTSRVTVKQEVGTQPAPNSQYKQMHIAAMRASGGNVSNINSVPKLPPNQNMMGSTINRRPVLTTGPQAPARIETPKLEDTDMDVVSFDGAEEDVEVKKAMRAERNRQSAAASRERKKHHIKELERRVTMLSQENAQLQVDQLQAIRARLDKERKLLQENKELKRKVMFRDMEIEKLSRELESQRLKNGPVEDISLKRPSTWDAGEWRKRNTPKSG